MGDNTTNRVIGKIEFEGNLTKKGYKVKNWKKRYFVLTQGFLYYFKKAQLLEATGVIPVRDIQEITEAKDRESNFCFSVNTSLRNYIIHGDNEKEREQWISALKRVKSMTDEVVALEREGKLNAEDSKLLYGAVVSSEEASDKACVIYVKARDINWKMTKKQTHFLDLHVKLRKRFVSYAFPDLKAALESEFQKPAPVIWCYLRELITTNEIIESEELLSFLDVNMSRVAEVGEGQLMLFLGKRNARDSFVALKNGMTPLHFACQKGLADVVEVLATNTGCDVNVKDNESMTPLHYAAQRGSDEIIVSLIKHGAQPNVKKKNGWTPLHSCAHGGHTKAAVALLDNGADVNCVKKKQLDSLTCGGS